MELAGHKQVRVVLVARGLTHRQGRGCCLQVCNWEVATSLKGGQELGGQG